MGWLSYLFLRFLHLIYALSLRFSAYWKHRSRSNPLPLAASRQKRPSHLAINFAVDLNHNAQDTQASLLEAVDNAARWCREAGISRLTVYDKSGILMQNASQLQSLIHPPEVVELSTDSEIEYPLTPPLSDYSRSRSASPDIDADEPKLNIRTIEAQVPKVEKRRRANNVKKRKRQASEKSQTRDSFILHVASGESSLPAIASAARSLQRQHQPRKGPFTLSIADLNHVLEGPDGFPSPDLMIVQHVPKYPSLQPPLELHSFPPWQTRLTELFYSRTNVFDEMVMREALDEFGGAQMRFGR